jgi:hypothetical protein
VLYDGNEASIMVVQEFLCIGKSRFAMGVLSGSSARVKELIHKEINDSRLDKYPNLNHTVYSERHLMPVRDKQELQKVSNFGVCHLIS